MLDINFAQIFIAFIVLLFSLTVHEMAHAWTADRLGDPTARLLGRVSLNPIVHADPIGTVLFPLVAIGQRRCRSSAGRSRCRSTSRGCGIRGATTCWSRRPGPASNLLLAIAGGDRCCGCCRCRRSTLGEPNVSVPIATLLSLALQINVLLAVFNMMPIPPLDGGNVLSGLLPPRLAAALRSRCVPTASCCSTR